MLMIGTPERLLSESHKRGGETVATNYIDYLPEDGSFDEDDLWQAIADSIGVDVSEIADGDLVEYL